MFAVYKLSQVKVSVGTVSKTKVLRVKVKLFLRQSYIYLKYLWKSWHYGGHGIVVLSTGSMQYKNHLAETINVQNPKKNIKGVKIMAENIFA